MGRQKSAAPIASAVRYAIIISHTLLSLTILLLCFLTTGSGIFLIIHICAGVATLIYIPAALLLSIKDSSHSFDHAGGEIAYATLQGTIWLASSLTATVFRIVARTCVQYSRNPTRNQYSNFNEGWSWYNDDSRSARTVCNILITIATLGYIQFVLTMSWVLWLAWLGHHAPGRSPAQAYMVPAHRLVNMSYHNDDELDLAEQQDMSRVNPYTGGLIRQEEPAPAYDEPYVSPPDFTRAQREVNEMMHGLEAREMETERLTGSDGSPTVSPGTNTATTSEEQQIKRDTIAITAPGPSLSLFSEKR